MEILVVVPLRRQSSRIPEKIYDSFSGKPLCVKAVEGVLAAVGQMSHTHVLAAVDDPKTVEFLKNTLPLENIILTDPAIPSGTDRVFAAARIYCAERQIDFNAVTAIVNVQGDMPFLSHQGLRSLWPRIMEWKAGDKTMLTPYEAWPAHADHNDLGNVKIATDKKGCALYFSRHPIPCSREFDVTELKLHVGVYAYTPSALEQFCKAAPTKLEKLEGLEQLRALYEGIPIECMLVECLPHESFRGIDTPSDIEWAVRFQKEIILKDKKENSKG